MLQHRSTRLQDIFWGWYAQAGYLLFGGTQRYDANGAKFTRVKRGDGTGSWT